MADTQRPHDAPDDDRADDAKRPWRLKTDPAEPDADERGKRKSGSGSLLREVVIIVGCVLLLTWVLQTFIGRQ